MEINTNAMAGHAGVQNSTAGLLPSRASSPVAASSTAKVADAVPANASAVAHQPTRDEIQTAVEQANTALVNRSSNELRFAVEEGAGMSVVKLIDLDSGDTIMQFPSKIMLEIAKTIDQVTGAIIKHKA